MSSIKLTSIPDEKRENYLDELLLADENESIVRTYLFDGELFSIQRDHKSIGVALFTFNEPGTVELKNIALQPGLRNHGYGKKVIDQAETYYHSKGYQKLIVATANSSIDNIAFYQKCGFRLVELEFDFFTNYPKPIYEHGIRAKDKLIFAKTI
ncbi:Acetyltransferase (GNAT) family protein [Pelagirhabdus alkalitolerans]|uniref:Acetyltransferase (GNAT) family protein n=1 Tax=Pelagirhabdus alkalitolerans TaxID=1612202 RepID=A0A1G6KXT9_9BACI|nr:GNAT family N-acetyltransferase [Pelagirhabdus alkalitolerans]SDC35912.1 Acetyltransferase (GNAT) family protein [Pelagirhabdus alkalitolerans]